MELLIASKLGEYVLSFGKHKGKQLQEVPASYLLWLFFNVSNLDDTIVQYIISIRVKLKDMYIEETAFNDDGHLLENIFSIY